MDDAWCCPICLSWFDMPIVTPCGHSFCGEVSLGNYRDGCGVPHDPCKRTFNFFVANDAHLFTSAYQYLRVASQQLIRVWVLKTPSFAPLILPMVLDVFSPESV